MINGYEWLKQQDLDNLSPEITEIKIKVSVLNNGKCIIYTNIYYPCFYKGYRIIFMPHKK